MKYVLGLLIGLLIGASIVYWWPRKVEVPRPKEYPLLKYTIENLGKRTYDSQIVLDDEIKMGVFKFHFLSDGKRVNGLAHIPTECEKCPVIVQFRGYADVENYESGYGTAHSAEVFAKEGFISLAPDFLGYGGSAGPSADVFEARFETYTTALNLLAAIDKWQMSNGQIGVWGHSNGGQIALTALEVTGKNYPTVLWAPVTASFPYSILYFDDDGKKLLRQKLAKFEEDYDTDLFSLTNYLDRIFAPVLIQQGTGDRQVPYEWNRDLLTKLKTEYIEYAGADHNMVPSWNEVVRKDIEFFKQHWYKL